MIMRQRGVTLIELIIAVTITGVLLAVAVPNITSWINNSQIRTASDTMLSGLHMARSEALGRNAVVRFQLTSTLDSSCTLSLTGTNWVVSLADPTSKCDVAPDPSGVTAPQTIQKKSGAESTPRAVISATGASVVYFNGFGRLSAMVSGSAVTNMTQIDISNTTGGTCAASGGTMRCLRILISSGGNVKLCDPAVAVSVPPDPRYCS
jgi:type IV fimbrial biogenesis protein FimT